MLISPIFPERAFFFPVVMFSIVLLSLFREISESEKIKRNIPAIMIFASVSFFISFIFAGKNIYGIYAKWEKRSQYIITQKENNILEIELKTPIPAVDRHAALYGLVDISEDQNELPNDSVALYFGVNSIRATEEGNEW
ncbi:DUF6056 family protein [Brucepastera parasyntrophica]|uniref:DUF6056 family protein n=1 Tax=Brucepastera parasyntrophica TaxID=2880008 RepID=UPI00210ABE38|nr:DUF6056 family protein [Brucepastera parasyntrophica]